ncbi:transposase [Streptomyces sp. SAI-124]
MLPSWLTELLWDQFAVLLPEQPEFQPYHPPGCHQRRLSDRVVFDKLLHLLCSGCPTRRSPTGPVRPPRSATAATSGSPLGVFARLKQIALEPYDRIVGLVLDQIAGDGSITEAPGGGEAAGRSPVNRGKRGPETFRYDGRIRHSAGPRPGRSQPPRLPLLAPTLDHLNALGPLCDNITAHLDAGYDSDKTRALLHERGLRGHIARKGRRHRSRPVGVGMSHAPTPGRTFPGSPAATSAGPPSSTSSSTSPTPSSPHVAGFDEHGPPTAGANAPTAGHDRTPPRARPHTARNHEAALQPVPGNHEHSRNDVHRIRQTVRPSRESS